MRADTDPGNHRPAIAIEKRKFMATAERMISTSHGRIAISETEGEGAPVFLIPGSFCKEVFRKQMEGTLGRKYRLVSMDLPGHGRSENAKNPHQTYTIPSYAEIAAEILRALGINEAAIVGWSLGGHIGIEMIGRFPEIRGLLVVGAPAVGKGQAELAQAFVMSEQFMLASKESWSEREIQDFIQHSFAGPDHNEPFLAEAARRIDGLARRTMFEAFLAGVGLDQKQVAETSRVPLAVVVGSRDHFVNIDYLKGVHYANLWEEQVHVLDNVGHAPFWDAPEVFDPLVERFLGHVFRAPVLKQEPS